MKKKVITAILCMCMGTSILAGCGKSTATGSTSKTEASSSSEKERMKHGYAKKLSQAEAVKALAEHIRHDDYYHVINVRTTKDTVLAEHQTDKAYTCESTSYYSKTTAASVSVAVPGKQDLTDTRFEEAKQTIASLVQQYGAPAQKEESDEDAADE